MLDAGVDKRFWVLIAAVVLGSAVGLYYYFGPWFSFICARAGSRLFPPRPTGPEVPAEVLILLMSAMLALGVYPGPFITLVRAAGLSGQ